MVNAGASDRREGVLSGRVGSPLSLSIGTRTEEHRPHGEGDGEHFGLALQPLDDASDDALGAYQPTKLEEADEADEASQACPSECCRRLGGSLVVLKESHHHPGFEFINSLCSFIRPFR